MGAYTGVQLCFNKPLAEVARQFHYSEANILILEGDEAGLKANYPEVYRNLLSCTHHADRRTPFMYGQDLVASWLFEDTFLAAIDRSSLFKVDLDGADKTRQILPNVRTSAASDYKLILQTGEERKLELMSDYTGYWSRTGKLHLRDAKYTKMENSQSLFIAVSVVTKEFALYDFCRPIPAKFIASHFLYGGKPAYEISIKPDMMRPYTSEILISEIELALGV